MAGVPPHRQGMLLVARLALIVLLVATLGTSIYGLLVIGGTALSVGWLLVAGSGALLAFGVLLYVSQTLAQKQSDTLYRTYCELLDAVREVRRQSTHMHTVAENSSLSDWAKQIVYREKDREYLGDQIRGAFVREDWAAAEYMITDLEEKLGYNQEAEAFRQELAQAQQSTEAEKIAAAIKRFDEQCVAERWKQAGQELQSLLKQYPDNEEIRGLPLVLDNRRQEFKRSLMKSYDEAKHRGDINAAHAVLLKLDSYLTPNEVTALKDSARDVFRARLEQLGEAFRLAVSDNRLEQAIEMGEGIIREYPNSGIAHEISEALPTLRQRAQGAVHPQ